MAGYRSSATAGVAYLFLNGCLPHHERADLFTGEGAAKFVATAAARQRQ